MTLKPLVLVALAVLVPVFCAGIREQRCELRDQIQRPGMRKLAIVICEVEKFVNQSLMGPTMSPATSAPSNSSLPALNSSTTMAPGPRSSSEEDSSEEKHSSEESSSESSSEESKGPKYLRKCVAITNSTSVKVDAACLRKRKVFVKIFLNAGEECKNIDPEDFFQGCPAPSNADPNSSSQESEDKSDSESKDKSDSKEESQEKSDSKKRKRH
ncbi:uncharacterized protein [Eucyclogobius newberryi]|uniref:uncharacterized protein n=1 Tax=Eucyclogobius newberryi TaxID=166745 RepID=UPI003B5A60CF